MDNQIGQFVDVADFIRRCSLILQFIDDADLICQYSSVLALGMTTAQFVQTQLACNQYELQGQQSNGMKPSVTRYL